MRLTFLLPLFLSATLFSQAEILTLENFAVTNPDFLPESQGVCLNNHFIFPATTDSIGAELWITDGTPDGTHLLSDISPGPSSSFPQSLFLIGDSIVIFTATSTLNGRELYRTDGTTEGTFLVRDIFPGAQTGVPSASVGQISFYEWRDRTYFSARSQSNNQEVWSTDGTAAGTFEAINIGPDTPGLGFIGSKPRNFIGNAFYLFFTTDIGSSRTPEVWRFDGTIAEQVSNLSIAGFGERPTYLTIFGDYLYFGAGPGNGESDLYRSLATSGSVPGTELLFNFEGDGFGFTPDIFQPFPILDSMMIFSAGNDLDFDLWTSNGLTDGTQILFDSRPGETLDLPRPFNLVKVEDLIFFFDETPTTGLELWRTDGSQSGTFLTRDLIAGSPNALSPPYYGIAHQGAFYFTANGTIPASGITTGRELYVSSGSSCTTFLVADLLPGEAGSSPYNLVSAGDKRYLFYRNEAGSVTLGVMTGTPTPPPVPELSFTIDSTNSLDCFGDSDGFAQFTINGGAGPYTFGDTANLTGQFELQGLQAGNYVVEVTDCRDSTINVNFSIFQPDSLGLILTELTGQNSTEGGTIGLDVTGGVPPYSLVWSDTSLVDNFRDNLAFGNYIATLTDARGCMVSDTFLVEDLTSTINLTPSDFIVYPTVSNEQVSVKMQNGHSIHRIEIHDFTGRRLSSYTALAGTTYSLTPNLLPQHNGIYLLSVWTQQGKRGVARIIIAR